MAKNSFSLLSASHFNIYNQSFKNLFRLSSYKPALLKSNIGTKHSSSLSAAKQTDQFEKEKNENKCKPEGLNFSFAKHGQFFQEQPLLGNQFLEDVPLRSYLKRVLPNEVFEEISSDLTQFGRRVATDIYQLGRNCELQPPKLVPQNAWGARVDDLQTCESWKCLHDLSAQEGIVAIGYEQKYGEWSRLYQLAKLYLFAPSAGLYGCPLAMTDGAAKTIQTIGYAEPRFQQAFSKLTSRDPSSFWTSGQWMTEKRGGSDVAGGTETVAVEDGSDAYRLYGYKWFSSALDANMALALARIVSKNGTVIPGTKGLALFYLETRDNSEMNNIQMVRLKEKLGTRQVATAELLLDGAVAYKMTEEGRGVAGMSNMLTMTRIHNAVSSVAGMRRILNLSRDYSKKRQAFGKPISEYPLHMQTLARMEVEIRGSILLILEVARILGRLECNKGTDTDLQLLRLLTPLAKLYTAKQAMTVGSEGLESFGGQGFMEDTGLPSMLRDAQVLPIWEGTTNILSLDVLRSIAKSNGEVLRAYHKDIISRLQSASDLREFQEPVAGVYKAMDQIFNFVQQNPMKLETAARDFSYSLTRTYIGALLIENAALTKSSNDLVAAKRWCLGQDLAPVNTYNMQNLYSTNSVQSDTSIVMDGYGSKI